MRSKTRLTITLPPELVRRLDGMVDRQDVRNRSHAVELLLRQSLEPTVRTAVILAGGSRRGLQIPPLAAVEGMPLITLTLRHLMGYGIRSFLILAGAHEDAIRELLGEGEALGARIRYVREPELRGTAGALKLAEPELQGDPFLVIHGDVLTDINIADFIRFHRAEHSLATIGVKPRHGEPRYGQVMLQGNRITDFLEKSGDGGISIVNTGVYLLEPGVLSLVAPDTPTRLETDVFPKLARMGQLSAFLFQGFWFDISSPQNYQDARSRWETRGGGRHERAVPGTS